MRCETCRELISADLDGEAEPDERRLVEAHRSSCPACEAYAIDATRLHRSMRVAAAAPVPDLTDAILERAASPAASGGVAAHPPRRRRRAGSVKVLALQYGLLVVALTIAVLAVPELLASSGAAVHTSRHLGGWDLAFAVGLVVAALQPWRARGLVPMAGALAGVMVVTAGLDIVNGYTPGVAEGSHLSELFGLVFLWLLSRSVADGDRPRRALPEPSSGGAALAPIARLRALPTRFGQLAGPVAPVTAAVASAVTAPTNPAANPVPARERHAA